LAIMHAYGEEGVRFYISKIHHAALARASARG
jgi:hypothetical protein